MTDAVKEEVIKPEPKPLNIAMAETTINSVNPWTAKLDDTDSKTKMELFQGLVNECRFFYKNEPLVATVINKMVDIAINDLVFSKNGLTDNEFKVFTSLKPKLIEFAENMAVEFLLSGLVVPEYSLGKIDKEDIKNLGIKRYETMMLPTSMWVRDPNSIKIDVSMISDKPTYSVVIPDDVASFINNNGKYPNGVEDKELLDYLKNNFPDFVKAVKSGKTEIVIDNNNVIRRRYLTDNQYPIPYVSSALDSLKHKRKLRQMDYSIADKVIGAMLHVKVGSDLFPITDSEEDTAFLDALRNQLTWRFNSKKDLERTFQLLTSHIVDINWVFPNTAELLNDAKYKDINLEILYGLGFPRSLITGESEKSSTSDPEMSMIGPVKTMENFRRKIIEVIRSVCDDVAVANKFGKSPFVEFSQLNLHNFNDLLTALSKLYETGGLSRQSYDDVLGYDFYTEIEKRKEEQVLIEDAGIPQVGLTPNAGNQVQTTDPKKAGEKSPATKKESKVEAKPMEKTNE